MLKFRADRRASQYEQNGTAGHPVIRSHLVEIRRPQNHLQSSNLDMSSKASGKRFVSFASDVNANNLNMVSDLSPEPQPGGQTPRAIRKAATFGKRSNSMRRNPTAEVTKQGWLYKQASNGVKQWNKRWFVLTDRCLFYYKDEKEEAVLGSLPLLSFRIGPVQPVDNISRKFAFKVFSEDDEDDSNISSTFCLQVEHAGTRTYYFSAESLEEQEAWVATMSEAACMDIPTTQRNNSENIPPPGLNNASVAKRVEPYSRGEGDGRGTDLREHRRGVVRGEAETPATALTPDMDGRGGERGGDRGRDRGRERVVDRGRERGGDRSRDRGGDMGGERGGDRGGVPQPNGWGTYGAYQPQESREAWEARDHALLHRGFASHMPPDRMAQRQNSMTQLQQWVNQRRGLAAQEELQSPSHYYTVNRGVPSDCYGVYGGPRYVEEYALYPPGVRPDSMCSVSGGFERLPPQWTPEEKRRSLRDGPLYPRGAQWGVPHAQQHPGYYAPLGQAQGGVTRLSMPPRSRSVPRSPSSSQGPYSPMRSPSARFDRDRDDLVYADPSIYGLRRSVSSPKYEFHRDRRPMGPAVYHYHYPGSLHDTMDDMVDLQMHRNLDYLEQQQVAPFHDIYTDLPPELAEIEIDNLLGRLCEQNRLLKEQEVLVQRLRVEKDSLEGALVATHQELEMYRGQPALADKLHMKKETLQNQLINIRGELSQASSVLTTTRMEFEVLEDEVNAIHGDLWEQLNAGGQSEAIHRHFQKEFWKIQDVLEGLHKNNPSRGTDTATHRVASLASGSFSTNSPASPLSSVSLTSPLSPFSPVSGSQASPPKQVGMEDVSPPRPPLPKSYLPLESPPSFPPSASHLPFDRGAWLCRSSALSGSLEEDYEEEEEAHLRQHKYTVASDTSSGDKANCDRVESENDRQANMNKVGIVPPRTKSPTEEELKPVNLTQRRNCTAANGYGSKGRPKSAVFPAEVKSKMSVEEQNERIRRNQSNSVRDKRRSLNLSGAQQSDAFRPSYRVVRRRLTAHEVDIKDLEAAVRGEGVESPREEIARLRRLQIEPEHYDLDVKKELSTDKVLIQERYVEEESDSPLSPEEILEKQKKVERIKTLIAKSNLQNVVPLLDGPSERQADPEQQLQEQEKRIEISCALAAEASRRSRLLSALSTTNPPASMPDLTPPPSADLSDSSHFIKV
ncbi:pleckstrin homology domain-containing family A member 6-like [Megalops cyprinoides]|uniref:pleckstrin homology domain-containing family A member 6-like n=1 Tax=Megalops cyprinoides TaxID=118141 RepID=UPI0018641C32|nr:pleckstrin homology domain-containing family A member 6-like [Megalops cyprinoides]